MTFMKNKERGFGDIKMAKKTKLASEVLQLMDKDYSYGDALKMILKENKITKEKLEKDLDPYI